MGCLGKVASPNQYINTNQRETMNDLTYLAKEEFKLVLNEDQADVLYDIYEKWQEQHNIGQGPCNQGDGSDHDLIAGYHFLANSRDYDNHKWLMHKIGSPFKAMILNAFGS